MGKKEKQQMLVNREQIEEKLRSFSLLPKEKLLDNLETSLSGLTDEQAEERLEEVGKNIIVVEKQKNIFVRAMESLINPFNLVLFIIAAVTFVTDVVIAAEPNYITFVIIVTLVFVSSLISFVQQEKSNNAAKQLKELITNKVDLIRGAKDVETSIEDVVPGDIITLSSGDMLPGDLRFLQTKDVFITQAALTGESNPVEKFSDHAGDEIESVTDLLNVGFMGSNMVSGSAKAVIIATGNNTYFGSMAESMSGSRSKNSFEKGVDSVSSLLIRFMMIMVPIIFLVNGITKKNWGEALIFAITMAVGLTPEMLPMIMTSTLAKGAVSMSKRKTIVKNISAIQTFGEMDILCTDKTGTLTEDKIVLEKYIDVEGKDDQRILRHAYLNSFYQTGLKNLIDVAIMNRANKYKLDELQEKYTRVDEIPFDFSRRRMSVVLIDKEGKRQLITKGAVDEIMSICKYVEINGEAVLLTKELQGKARDVYEKHNHDGLRIIAVAQKNNVRDEGAFSVEDESNMVLMGFVAFLDPPKASSKLAIEALKEHGVRTVVLTGDSEGVALNVCRKVGISTTHCLTGKDIEQMEDEELKKAVEECSLFSKLSPYQKERIVQILQEKGHTVGYMGDGINDGPSLRQADVGISVDSAVDIAKETADIILLEKDLMVLEQGVVEGRKTFGNIIKYIKMASSGNFGNMISVMVASIVLPFLPLLPIHILMQNLLCDFSQMGMPFDNVDTEYIQSPRKWNTKTIRQFMLILGPISSLFDILCFAVMWYIIKANTVELAPIFQTGLFVFGSLSQILVVYMIRTQKIPFIQSRPSKTLTISTLTVAFLVIVMGFTGIAYGFDLAKLPLIYIGWLIILLIGYCGAIEVVKKIYVKRYGEWV